MELKLKLTEKQMDALVNFIKAEAYCAHSQDLGCTSYDEEVELRNVLEEEN